MHRLTLLLVLALTLLQSLAKPLPISMDEYERRWSKGETEVCCSPNAPGCYVLAWFRSLGGPRPASIHQNHNIREASPAWPIVRRYDEIEGSFAYATDERTMEVQRIGSKKRSERGAKMSKSLMQKMKSFVKDFYRKQGEKSDVVIRPESVVDADEAPVLKPRRGYRYHFNA